jgi:hypothetical protein
VEDVNVSDTDPIDISSDMETLRRTFLAGLADGTIKERRKAEPYDPIEMATAAWPYYDFLTWAAHWRPWMTPRTRDSIRTQWIRMRRQAQDDDLDPMRFPA